MDDPGRFLEPHAVKATLLDAVSDPDPAVRFRAFHRVLRDETDPELRSKAERALTYDQRCRTSGNP
jgi:hypothetical protein